MLKRPFLTVLLGVLLAATLVLGVTRLFVLRFEHGDVYPAYSTLRTDPLGAKVYFEALDQMPGCKVERNFRPLARLNPGQPITLIYAGLASHSAWGLDEFAKFQSLLANGHRVVLVFKPENLRDPKTEKPGKDEKDGAKKGDTKKEPGEKAGETPETNQPKTTPSKSPKPTPAKPAGKDKEPSKDEDEEVEIDLLTFSDVASRLGFGIETANAGTLGEAFGTRRAVLAEESGAALEPEISWHSATFFKDLKPGWRSLYQCEGRTVLAERNWGAGSLVLASDSYFLSNEALRKERCPRLLGWLAGPSRLIVFDEEHHGLSEETNIATLVRKYRLHGFVAGLLLCVALFVWKSSMPFLPPLAVRRPDAGLVAGKGADEGFINLIQRALKPAELLALCAAEWKKAFDPEGRTRHGAQIEEVLAAEAARPARERDPVGAYRTISRILSQKK